MNYPKVFFYSCLFFILGVSVRTFFDFDFFWAYLILLSALSLIILSFRNRYYLVIGFCLLFLFFGIGRYQLSLPDNSKDSVSHYNDQSVELIGIVNKEPDQRQDKVKLELKVSLVNLDEQWQKVQGKVLVTSYLFPEYKYGDKLEVFCDLQSVEPIENFAYDKYLARYDIYSLCYYPKINLVDHKQGNFILASILDFKNHFVSRINRILAEPHSSFLSGLLIGAKKAIPENLQLIFNKTGTTHIIAVSGYNITIIATFLLLFSQNLSIPRKKAFWLIILILIVFAILTGLQASIIRASIMGGLVLLASYLGRRSQIKNALVLTVVLMLLVNPTVLVYDLGFQLSFLATLGLIYFNPLLFALFKIKKWRNGFLKILIGDYFLTTLSAIILTTPIILYNFGKISLVAPLANILVLPFIPIAMLLGFIAGLLSLIFIPMGEIAGWSVWLVLTGIIQVLEKLSELNWAYFEFSKISLLLMLGMYMIIFGLMYKFRQTIKLS